VGPSDGPVRDRSYRLAGVDPSAFRLLSCASRRPSFREAEELRAAITAGAVLRDRHGRRLRPLGLASLKKLTETLAAILDEAIEDEYAQLQQRVEREHRTAFDRLVDQAREQLHGTSRPAPTERRAWGLGHGIGHEASERANKETSRSDRAAEKPRRFQKESGMARPGLEPGTPRFSEAPEEGA